MNKQRLTSFALVQRGFTLIELLVVVAVLATMAGIAASVVGGYDQQAREQLVHTEMKNIAKAIYRFKQDTGYFPKEGVFLATASVEESDMDFLYLTPKNGSNAEISPWDIDNSLGWNGPYLSIDSQQRLHVPYGSPPESDCDITAVDISHSIISVEDTFEALKKYTNADSCFAIRDAGNWVSKNAAGQPYRYLLNFVNAAYPNCDGGSGCLAILSAGKDGVYENGDDDDVVKVLRVNK